MLPTALISLEFVTGAPESHYGRNGNSTAAFRLLLRYGGSDEPGGPSGDLSLTWLALGVAVWQSSTPGC